MFINKTIKEGTMFKKMTIIAVLILTVFAFSSHAGATTTPYYNLSDYSTFLISGAMTIKVDFKNWVTLTVLLPKVQNFQEYYMFNYDGTFSDMLLTTALGMSEDTSIPLPYWTQNGSAFLVDFSGMADAIEASLTEMGLSADANKNPILAGKIDKKGNISGKLNLGWDVSVDASEAGLGTLTGAVTITMSFKGTPTNYTPIGILSQSEQKDAAQVNLKNIISEILSRIPVK
jgi:hypothetical protein